MVNAVLVADHFPELGSDLVAALATLDVQDFSHFSGKVKEKFWLSGESEWRKGSMDSREMEGDSEEEEDLEI